MGGTRGRMTTRAASLALAALLGVASVGGAQQERPSTQDRAALESRFRTLLDARLKHELELSDAQSAQLRTTMNRFDVRRRQLIHEERSTRVALRKELEKGDAASDARVSPMIDRMLELQERRVALVQEEQRELARFLTPVQRARYLSLQENLRRQIQQGTRDRSGGKGHTKPPGDHREKPERPASGG